MGRRSRNSSTISSTNNSDGSTDNTPRRVQSLGSGFVIDPSGIIVTNNHVIEGADEITANFTDGTKLTATLIGFDDKTDLALLKVNADKPLPSVKFGDSAALRVGDWVMAIGNPFGLGGTVTLGIVSARNRDINAGPYDDFIQTDAAINRGNSGGPLFNLEGEVVGINTAIISPTGGSIGIGFAVPSEIAVGVIDQLRQFGETRRGWLGVHIQEVTDEVAGRLAMAAPHGALVADVDAERPGGGGRHRGRRRHPSNSTARKSRPCTICRAWSPTTPSAGRCRSWCCATGCRRRSM